MLIVSVRVVKAVEKCGRVELGFGTVGAAEDGQCVSGSPASHKTDGFELRAAADSCSWYADAPYRVAAQSIGKVAGAVHSVVASVVAQSVAVQRLELCSKA